MKWHIDHHNMTKARSILNLTLPVNIKSTRQVTCWGEYDVEPVHQIWLSTSTPADMLNFTLWHELGHAMQCERDWNGDGHAFGHHTWETTKEFWTKIRKLPRVRKGETYEEWEERYLSLPDENEAEEIAFRYYDEIPLIIPIA